MQSSVFTIIAFKHLPALCLCDFLLKNFELGPCLASGIESKLCLKAELETIAFISSSFVNWMFLFGEIFRSSSPKLRFSKLLPSGESARFKFDFLPSFLIIFLIEESWPIKKPGSCMSFSREISAASNSKILPLSAQLAASRSLKSSSMCFEPSPFMLMSRFLKTSS